MKSYLNESANLVSFILSIQRMYQEGLISEGEFRARLTDRIEEALHSLNSPYEVLYPKGKGE